MKKHFMSPPRSGTPLDHDRGGCPSIIPTNTISSRLLLAGSREVGIEHEGLLYRLKVTRQGKLILNK